MYDTHKIHGTIVYFPYIYHQKATIHVGEYTIHRCYGIELRISKMANPGVVWVFRMEVDPPGVNHVVVPYTVRDLGVDVSGLVPF